MIVLASTSAARRTLLQGAGISFVAEAPGVEEEGPKAKLVADGAAPERVAEMLAGLKAVTVSQRRPGDLVIGADQTLDLDGELISKAGDLNAARARLYQLRGRRHRLHSAVVVARDGRLLWRLVATAALSMRVFSPEFLDGYLERNADAALASVGCYQLEGEGAQLFDAVDGDYFSILGLPLIPLMEFLRDQGALAQ